ncbi:MAG: ABC transporter ATP-binding protein [Sphaerochaeta sp.]|nr:ABC transporter ATP-binding protein [Sphaerochaeta sp.]
MKTLHIRNVSKSYGAVKAVDNLSLDLREGELLAILGSSGSGKSTLLSCIAGIEKPEEGEITLNGRCLFSSERNIQVSPEHRKIGFVFQNYALWPHMTVFENVEYPLKMAKIASRERKEIVQNNLNLVELYAKGDRYPHELSGGEQQRVALSRALVMEPDLLLLDEPLSNLDARLRETMQLEIRKIQQKLNLSVIHVTHDQAEAIAMGDRIAVMHQGEVIQRGTPQEIYENPKTRFVANFVGTNTIMTGTLTHGETHIRITGAKCLTFPINLYTTKVRENQPLLVAVRPENVILYAIDKGPVRDLPIAVVNNKVYKGAHILYEIICEQVVIRVQSHPTEQFTVGDTVHFHCTRVSFIPTRGYTSPSHWIRMA